MKSFLKDVLDVKVIAGIAIGAMLYAYLKVKYTILG